MTAPNLRQPYAYRRIEAIEPEWQRFPGWRDVTAAQWRDVSWQRTNSIKTIRRLRDVLGDLVDDVFYEDAKRDQASFATMSMLITPQVLNTMVPHEAPSTDSMYADPVRRYVLPVASDRDPHWPTHPRASRDSLHETEMWVVEGLIHRYPTKVLAEMLTTCPLYCGHCTRMDLVGPSTPQVAKGHFATKAPDRREQMLEYLRTTPSVRDVVVSGGDLTNLPWPRLESFLDGLLEIENIRDIRLASKGLMSLPQHWLSDEIRAGVERVATKASARGVSLAIHTHVNVASQVTQLFTQAAGAMIEAGVHHIRNQGVLLRGVNASPDELLDLCFAVLDNAGVIPYYFYLCDMIPASEHWRLSLAEAQEIQHAMMGYLPGFATPRLVCDVPYVGKRWVDQVASYDRELGISYWTKNYLTPVDAEDPEALLRRFEYYDPIRELGAAGKAWWEAEMTAANGASTNGASANGSSGNGAHPAPNGAGTHAGQPLAR
jgi:lysine 2,3-aminomutase